MTNLRLVGMEKVAFCCNILETLHCFGQFGFVWRVICCPHPLHQWVLKCWAVPCLSTRDLPSTTGFGRHGLCFEWDWNTVLQLHQTLQAGTCLVFALVCLCCTWQNITGNNWGKQVWGSSCFKTRNANVRFCEVSKQDDSKSLDVIFSLSHEMKFLQGKELTLQSASLPTNLILFRWKTIPAQLFPARSAAFLSGPDLFLSSVCFPVIKTAPKLWERHQNSCGYFKVWQSC